MEKAFQAEMLAARTQRYSERQRIRNGQLHFELPAGVSRLVFQTVWAQARKDPASAPKSSVGGIYISYARRRNVYIS